MRINPKKSIFLCIWAENRLLVKRMDFFVISSLENGPLRHVFGSEFSTVVRFVSILARSVSQGVLLSGLQTQIQSLFLFLLKHV